MSTSAPQSSSSDSQDARRILFVYYRDLSTFIERDWKIVARAFPGSELFCFRGVRDIWRLRAAQRNADLCLCWFGGRHALAAALWKKPGRPLVIVAGGWDVSREDSMHYGAFARFPHSVFGRWIFGRADLVLAVSQYCADTARTLAGVPNERLRLIYHGFDPEAWVREPLPRTIDVITVSGNDVVRKSIDLIALAAARLPAVAFQIVGAIDPLIVRRLVGELPPNVTLVGRLDVPELKRRLGQARVYLQPSRHECFGCAVAEAMLMGCIPVVARASAQPEVVGEAGYYAEEFTADAVARAVSQALAAPESARAAARARIASEFAMDRYAARLVDCLRELAD